MNVAIKAVVPLLILIFLGYISRKINILKAGDERVLSAYVYYFALPSLFFVAISEIRFNTSILLFILGGVAPILILQSIYVILYLIFKFKRSLFYLISLSTIFGSLAFFGIPFIIFAIPSAEEFATFQAAMISVVAVSLAIALLELYATREKISKSFSTVARKLSKNPLIISIIIGLFFSILNIKVPSLISAPLHMLGKSTSVVAIFMLGVFLYGREYKNIKMAFGLSMLRMFLLPSIALFFAFALQLNKMEETINVLMNAMPMAVSMMVLSHRYHFYEDVIASIILISSIGAIVYLNIWLWILSL